MPTWFVAFDGLGLPKFCPNKEGHKINVTTEGRIVKSWQRCAFQKGNEPNLCP